MASATWISVLTLLTAYSAEAAVGGEAVGAVALVVVAVVLPVVEAGGVHALAAALARPQPAWISTVTRSPISNSSTPGPSAATVPMYSWPGVKSLLKGSPPWIWAGGPCAMISRSVAQMATPSMRTRTSARLGSGTGFSTSDSSSGSPRTQAFMVSGTGNAGSTFTSSGCGMLRSPRLDADLMRRARVRDQRGCAMQPTGHDLSPRGRVAALPAGTFRNPRKTDRAASLCATTC